MKENINPTVSNTRPLSVIAQDIRKNWPNVNFAAKPYLSAMQTMNSIKDDYGQDSGQSIVAYFLSNASTWRGPEAKRIKSELKSMLTLRENKSMKTQKEQLKEVIKGMLKEILETSEYEVGDKVLIGNQWFVINDIDVNYGRIGIATGSNKELYVVGDDGESKTIMSNDVDGHERGDPQSRKALQSIQEGRKRKAKKKKIEEEDQQVAPPAPTDVPEVKPEAPPAPTAATEPAPSTGAPAADKQKSYKYLLGAMKAMIKNGTITGVSEEEMVPYAQSLYKTLNKSIEGASLEKLGAGEEAPTEEPAPTEPEAPITPPTAPAEPAPEAPAPEVPAPEAPTAPSEPAAEVPAPAAPAPKEQPVASVPEKPKARPAPKTTDRQPTNMVPEEPKADEENTDQLKEVIRKIVEGEIEEYRTKGALGKDKLLTPSATKAPAEMALDLKRVATELTDIVDLDDLRVYLDMDPIVASPVRSEVDEYTKEIINKLSQLEKSTNPDDVQLLSRTYDIVAEKGWLKNAKASAAGADVLNRRFATDNDSMKQALAFYKENREFIKEEIKRRTAKKLIKERIDSGSSTTSFITVLDDGETFTGAEGCIVAELSSDALNAMHNDSRLDDVDVVRKWQISIVNGAPKLTMIVD